MRDKRVIGASGALTGFASGLKAKDTLLALEKAGTSELAGTYRAVASSGAGSIRSSDPSVSSLPDGRPSVST